MTDILFFVAMGISLLATAVWLLRPPKAFRSAQSPTARCERADLHMEDLAASHCRFFPQLRQSLSSDDDAYLQARASPAALREWRQARRAVVRKFLAGLCEDFAQLNRMARAIARVAPRLDHLKEAELFWQGLRFRLVYCVAVVELGLGIRPAQQIKELAEMIGGLGSTLERITSAIAEHSASSALTS